MTFRIPIVSIVYLILQVSVVLRVEGRGAENHPNHPNHPAEEVAARRARDLLQSTIELPAAPAPDAPDRTWLALTQCHEHCRQCDRYGKCGACKEGYVPVQGDLGLECACVDSDCFSCPENPGVCAVCAGRGLCMMMRLVRAWGVRR